MEKRKNDMLWLDTKDNVAIALRPLIAGETVAVKELLLVVQQDIPKGHKMAIRPIPQGGMVIKYGEEIGEATCDIQIGQHVHIHNVRDITAEVTERERRRLGL